MCFTDNDGPSAFFQTIRRARKPHRCYECNGDVIKPGDRYEYISGVWDRVGMDFATCLGCVSLRAAVEAHEIASGCHPADSIPPIGDAFSAAVEHGLICHVRDRDDLIDAQGGGT